MSAITGLDKLMGGAVTERFEAAMQEVVKNILDPNTDATKARTITLTVTIKPNKGRDSASFAVVANPKLVPRTPVETMILFGADEEGNVVANEYKRGVTPGQIDMDGKVYGDKVTPITKIK